MKKLVLNVMVSLLLLSCMAAQQVSRGARATKGSDVGSLINCPRVTTSTGNWERYKPSSFENLLTTVSQVSHRDSKEGIGLYVTTGDKQFPSCVRMEYKDQYREIAEPGKTFYATLESVFNEERLQNLVQNLQHEALFVENRKEYWIPVYEPLIPFMQNELDRNKPTTLFMLWMGTIYVNDTAEYVFYIGEFSNEK
jgi:hypothetical protein